MSDPVVPIRMNGNSVYSANQYLKRGRYKFIINAPFNTQMLVIPVNPVPGLDFLDQDPAPNVFNAQLSIPQDGQYGFKITLDRPVSDGELNVMFIRQGETDNSGTDSSTAPGQPSPAWRFIYASPGNPNSNLNVTVRNGRYLINWYNGQTHQTFYTWNCAHETSTGLICSEAQNAGVTQRLGISSNWKTIWMGKNRFDFVKKEKT